MATTAPGTWGQAQGSDAGRERAWPGLVVLIISLPAPCSASRCTWPRLQPRRRRDPRTAPRVLALQLRKKRPGSSQDTPAPSCPPSPSPRNLQSLTNKSWNITRGLVDVPKCCGARASAVALTLPLAPWVLPGHFPNRSRHWPPQVRCWCHPLGDVMCGTRAEPTGAGEGEAPRELLRGQGLPAQGGEQWTQGAGRARASPWVPSPTPGLQQGLQRRPEGFVAQALCLGIRIPDSPLTSRMTGCRGLAGSSAPHSRSLPPPPVDGGENQKGNARGLR